MVGPTNTPILGYTILVSFRRRLFTYSNIFIYYRDRFFFFFRVHLNLYEVIDVSGYVCLSQTKSVLFTIIDT